MRKILIVSVLLLGTIVAVQSQNSPQGTFIKRCPTDFISESFTDVLKNHEDRFLSLSEAYTAMLRVALKQRKQSASLQEILDLLARGQTICQIFGETDVIRGKKCNKCLENPRRNPTLVRVVLESQNLLDSNTNIFLNRIKEWLDQCLNQ